MITEAFVLANCMHNSDEILRDVFFPQFKDELDIVVGVPATSGYHSAIQCVKGVTFEGWKVKRFAEFRKARYLPIDEQLDMNFHDRVNGTSNWLEHINDIKQRYPKT